jgi:hypothetical protein
MSSITGAVVVLSLALALGAAPARAQSASDSSSYDANAIRIKTSFWGASTIVAGTDEHVVGKVGMFPSNDTRVFLAQRSEKAAEYFGSYRSKQISGSLLYLVSIGAIVAGVVVFDPDVESSESLSVGLMVGGFVATLVAAWRWSEASDDLATSVWWYNREVY